VILAQATPATAALQRESNVIPIVFVTVADPIGSGFVASLARPGGNLTGLLLFEASITAKWLAMLREIAPGLTHATLVINPKSAPFYEFYLRAAQAAASSLGIELGLGSIESAPADIERAFEAFARISNGGLILPPDTNATIHRELLVALAARHRLPAVYSDRQFVVAGGLMCYSTDRVDQYGWPHPMSTASCGAQNLPIFQYRCRPSTKPSSISRRRRHLVLNCLRACSSPPTR
jgi:ABC-type uncharacterized transport system substrate-binding protein